MNELRNLEMALKGCGKNPLVIDDSIIVLPYGGRVLGLFPDGETNVFWVNDALRDAGTATSYFNADGWLNSGGDRTWISPEGETHVPDLSQYPASIEVPGSVDPVPYEVMNATCRSVSIGASMRVRFHQSGVMVPLRIEKRVRAYDRPPVDVPEGVRFAGYQADTVLRVPEPVAASARPGIWSLLQVPGGGEILCPVCDGAAPTAFFNQPAFQHGSKMITAPVETDTSYKFGLKAHNSTGRLLYRKLNGAQSMLVVRNFTVAEDSQYADYPCWDAVDDGYLTEIYIDDGQLGGFGEMEYHSPAIELKDGQQSTEDSSETWGFIGPEEAIEGLVGRFVREVG